MPMMRDLRIIHRAALLALCLAPLACAPSDAGSAARTEPPRDPLTAEAERVSALLKSEPALRKENEPILTRAQEDLRQGRRQLALLRLANLRANISSTRYWNGISAERRKDMASVDVEWKRMGGVLREDLESPAPGLWDGVPAAARGVGEAARAQVRGYYHASLDYAHNTMPDQGYLYLAAAEGQRELAAFSRTLSASSSLRAPALRSIRPEMEALEADMLAVYRPPLSVERHGEFIVTSSTLKEARELDAAGLRHGALLRYLQAAEMFAPLRQPASPALAADALTARLREHEARLSAGGIDHSLGQLFLESAQADPARASIIATDVLPRYFAALEPARPEAPKPAPLATVTLVRWPYT